jgi:hypothetical protein
MRELTVSERRKLSATRSLAAMREIERMHQEALTYCRRHWEANNRLPVWQQRRIWDGLKV